MKEALINPSLATVRAVIERYCGLHAIPNFATLSELMIDVNTKHAGLRTRIFQVFGKDVKLQPSDTIHSITEKLLAE